jgi:hypothetical protein
MAIAKKSGKRLLTDEELLALPCPDCEGKLYTAPPKDGFTPQQRTRQRARCESCQKIRDREKDRIRQEERRDSKNRVVRGSPARDSEPVEVGSRDCGHRWTVKTAVPQSVLMNGGTKLKCPECNTTRRAYAVAKIIQTQGLVRKCDRCEKKLSTYNPGPNCWACERQIVDELVARVHVNA